MHAPDGEINRVNTKRKQKIGYPIALTAVDENGIIWR